MSTYFAPITDQMYDAMQEAQDAEQDAYTEWCAETGRDADADNSDAWAEFKQSCFEAEMDAAWEQEMQDRMEMGDEWYE